MVRGFLFISFPFSTGLNKPPLNLSQGLQFAPIILLTYSCLDATTTNSLLTLVHPLPDLRSAQIPPLTEWIHMSRSALHQALLMLHNYAFNRTRWVWSKTTHKTCREEGRLRTKIRKCCLNNLHCSLTCFLGCFYSFLVAYKTRIMMLQLFVRISGLSC